VQVDTFTPRVYRENAFLTTGPAVDAGGREIRRYRDRKARKYQCSGSHATPIPRRVCHNEVTVRAEAT
jgi:hypothetical protein